MERTMKKIVFLFLIICALPLGVKALPLEHFASLPDVSRLQLSPNGKNLLSVVRVDVDKTQGEAVQVANLETNEKKIILFTDNQKYIVNWIRWKDDQTVLVATFHPDKRDTWQARFNTRETRLFIINTHTGEVTAPFSKKFLKKYKIMPSSMDRVVDTLPDDPDHILIAFQTRLSDVIDMRGKGIAGVFKVNIRNQNAQLIQDSLPHVVHWMTDQQHRVRVGIYYHVNDGTLKVLIKNLQTGKWMELWPHTVFGEDSVEPLGFDKDPNILYIRAYHRGRLAIFKVDLADPALTRQLVFADPVYDVNGQLVYSPVSGQVVGITYSTDGGFVFFDPGYQQLQASIDKALPNTKNYVHSFSKDEGKYLVFSTSSTDSGTYYLGLRSPARLEAVAHRYKHLTPELMSPVKRYDYEARDGLKIEAYLTLPRNAAAGKKLPAIMFPHGGPIARDDDSFDYWAQYFADKGYAVLKMNFRGSAGQGLEFRNAGLKNWGKEMQDDIEDGARKLIEDGIVDEKSICIVGASYGGYAALMGAVKTPDFYRCAISVNGVSNVSDLVKDNRTFRHHFNIVDELIGRDSSHLKAISPVNHADKIKIPVLLVHGDNDRQVDIKHSTQMRDALTKAGKKVVFLELKNEDHFLTNNANRIATFRAMDDFLNEHLPVAPGRNQ